ncbi:MAG: CDP-diacylglycerol--serine O-phosphatidyltransferase [Burkholderiales bacterium]
MAEFHPPRKGLLRGTLRRRGIYILPNLFTTGVLFGGFYAIVQAMNARYEHAAIAIFVAMVLDGLDGRVARLTRTQSEFGAEYDSLADVVAFGAAPALVMYEWALRPLGRLGWIAAFAYCAATALRLARFNVNIEVVDKRYFQGLPCPAAAAVLAGFVWVIDDFDLQRTEWLHGLASAVTFFMAVTMVTSLPFYSFKDINFRRSVPFWAVLVIVLGLMLVSANPPMVLFLLFVAYAASGYVLWAWRFRRSRPLL